MGVERELTEFALGGVTRPRSRIRRRFVHVRYAAIGGSGELFSLAASRAQRRGAQRPRAGRLRAHNPPRRLNNLDKDASLPKPACDLPSFRLTDAITPVFSKVADREG